MPSRKRLRSAVLFFVSLTPWTIHGFVAPSTALHHCQRSTGPPLFATSIKASSAAANKPSRLTRDEEQELLRQVVELRRLKNLQSSTSSSTSLLTLSQVAGYGEDLEACEDAISLGHKARETLVTRNMGLVYYCVSEIVGRRANLQSLSRDDLVQEGAIGLARAVDRWNPEIGGKFSTYAYYWIRAAVLRGIAERDDIVRVPEHVSTAVRKMTKAAKNLGLEIDGDGLLSSVYSSDSSWKEAQAAKALAEEAGLTSRQLEVAMKVQQRRRTGMLSFEAWMQQGRDFKSDLAPSSDETMASNVDTDVLKKTLARFLRPRELEALSLRYGLVPESGETISKRRDYVAEAETFLYGPSPEKLPVRGRWGEAMSFVEVGKRMKVSAEYGRRLCHAALEKLRRAAEEGTLLEPAFLL